MAGDINLNAVAPCPSCGHCPTCGRGGYRTLPYNPWPYPYYSYPYWSIIQPNAGQYPTYGGTGITYTTTAVQGSTVTINDAMKEISYT